MRQSISRLVDPTLATTEKISRALGRRTQQEMARADNSQVRYLDIAKSVRVRLGENVMLEEALNLDFTGSGVNVEQTGEDTVEITVAGGSGAPTGAKYITQTADAGLSAEQSLGLLTTGLVKNTVSAGVGVLSTADGSDIPSHNHAATQITSGVLPAVRGGTGESVPVAGSILIGFDSDTWAQLLPNVTATRKFARSVSSGNPAWDTLVAGDLPSHSHVDADIPDTITIANLTQITTRSHTSLTDIGTNPHSTIDTHLAAANPHSGSQPLDTDLTTIASLVATTDNFIVSVSSAWASRTVAQVKTTLALNNVDNTSNATERAAVATLASKTLTTPTIAATGFTNANHAHAAANSGGTLDAAAIASGVFPSVRNAASPVEGSVLTHTGGVQAWAASVAGSVDSIGLSVDNAVVVFDGTSGRIIKMADGIGNNAVITNSANLLLEAGCSIDMSNTVGDILMGTGGSLITDEVRALASLQLSDVFGNELVKFVGGVAAVNEITITNKATGTGPTIAATGGDTDINLNLIPKGAGVLQANGVTIADATNTLTMSGKTLTTPTIASFTNATHDHSNAAGGGATLQSPTIVTPTIASLVNANHTHLTAAGGGQLSSIVTLGPFYMADIPGTATTQMSAMFMNTTTAVSQSTGEFMVPKAGEVIGIIVVSDANRTAGTATFTVTVNGTSQTFDGGAVCALDATNTRRHSILAATGNGEDVAAGNRVGIQCVTSGWTPITADCIGYLVVRLDF